MPYHVPTLSTSLKSRLADVKQQQMAETAEEKARKRKELETEFVTEEKIFQYPKAVQDRIREIRASDLSAQEKRAKIAKLVAEAKYGTPRTGKLYPLTDEQASQKWKAVEDDPNALDNPENTKMLHNLRTSEGEAFIRDVDTLLNRNSKLQYREAAQIVFDAWKRLEKSPRIK